MLIHWIKYVDTKIVRIILRGGAKIMLDVSAFINVMLMIIIVIDVATRRTDIRSPWGAGGWEISEVLMTQLTALALAWCLYSGYHVRNDWISEKYPMFGRIIRPVGYFLGALWTGATCWIMVMLAMSTKANGGATDVVRLILWPFQFLFAISFGLAALGLLRACISYILELFGYTETSSWAIDIRDTEKGDN
jgi:TRAP-type mannitol/chloroaromatic compound transport system permease small subunit